MGFQIVQSQYRQTLVVVSGIFPFYGTADSEAPITEQLVLNLQNRGPTASRLNSLFAVNSSGNDSYFYAYPVSYGEATFQECDANGNVIGIGTGSWDGANGDPIGGPFGPVVINVTIGGSSIPFYVYESDWPNLGLTYWKVT